MRLISSGPLVWGIKKACSHSCHLRPSSSWRRSLATRVSRTYDDAIDHLNSLQTPFKVLSGRWGKKPDKLAYEEGINQMRKYLKQIGYTQNDLSQLNVVHVAGTKGKGSTCAYVDSILSQYTGSRGGPTHVGLFTSPHLVSVRERIRLDSKPISRELFAKCFFEVWDRLSAAPEPLDKPVYFRYLTLMSFHVFIQEKVDAAIYEVGVGGEYDATNIIDRPAVTGISTLGLDHTFALGEVVDQIAWHKAGIFKQDVPAFTVPQLPDAMDVVISRAKERKVSQLIVVGKETSDDLDTVLRSDIQRFTDWRSLDFENVAIRTDAGFQKLNASLAVALADALLKTLDPSFEPTMLPEKFKDGLEQMVWHGRCETKVEGNVTWYLDGAHTADSVKVASQWFSDEAANVPATHVLIFNQQGHRDNMQLLGNLFKCTKLQQRVNFEHVLFCPTVPVDSSGSKGTPSLISSSSTNSIIHPEESINHMIDPTSIKTLQAQKALAGKWQELDPSSSAQIKVLPSVEDAIAYVRNLNPGSEAVDNKEATKKRVHVLVTGSIHLVGRVLGILEGVDAL